MHGSAGYAAWAGRYLAEFGASREDFGRIAINDRTNAAANPNAVLRQPLTIADYLGGRMVREPLCLYDMDVPVDGADAFIVTTAERARDLRAAPVLIHAASHGHDRAARGTPGRRAGRHRAGAGRPRPAGQERSVA